MFSCSLNAQQSSFPSASSTQALAHGGVPELLLGLSYNATTGRLSVEVIKGSHFQNLAATRPPGLLETRLRLDQAERFCGCESQMFTDVDG